MENKNYLYKGFHSVERLDAVIKGEKKIIERIGIKNAVSALVTDADGKIAFVRQYRPCIDECLYEIPAGLMDKDGLTGSEILTEELYEECEIKASDIEFISKDPMYSYYVLCGSSDAKMSIYRVSLRSVECSKEVADEDVDKVEWLTYDEFDELAQNGKIKDEATLIAYLHLKEEMVSA